MTVDPVMLKIFMAVITILVLGGGGEKTWGWAITGGPKKGGKYIFVPGSGKIWQKCCGGFFEKSFAGTI